MMALIFFACIYLALIGWQLLSVHGETGVGAAGMCAGILGMSVAAMAIKGGAT